MTQSVFLYLQISDTQHVFSSFFLQNNFSHQFNFKTLHILYKIENGNRDYVKETTPRPNQRADNILRPPMSL